MGPTASIIDLAIVGSAGDRLRRSLAEGEIVRVGRSPGKDGICIAWDPKVSREHADLFWDGDRLHIKCVDLARNPIIYKGQAARTLSVFRGERFTIGETVFVALAPGELEEVQDVEPEFAFETPTAEGVIEQAFSSQELNSVAFGNASKQLELLAGLPQLISGSHSDEDLAIRLGRLLLRALPAAEGVAVARFDETTLPKPGAPPESLPKPLMMQVETRPDFQGRFRPSRRLILTTLTTGQNAMHVWGGDSAGIKFTVSEGLGWAFATPIRGESCRGWCLYVAGKGSADGGLIASDDELKADLRFTELVAQFIGSVRQVRLLQEEKTQLSSFLSPNVIRNLTSDKEVLKPAERDITVLFCDVRGFSQKSEAMGDDLHTLLESMRVALGVMSNAILERDGTIADFQGDAALGFWGWPVELELGPIPACRAALDIYRSFRRGASDPESLLYEFSVGIGVAHGRAIAGQIGTVQQAKVGVFGPVVNQGARLEGLTRQFGVPICLDEPTADWVKQKVPDTQARVRRLGRVRPKGMTVAINVFGLLPAEHEMPEVSGGLIMLYDLALNEVTNGRWEQARQILGRIPDTDGSKQFILEQMELYDNTPPPDWDGAFSLQHK